MSWNFSRRTRNHASLKPQRRKIANLISCKATGLTDHFALIADAAFAFLRESLHSGENRIGIEMRFRDYIRFEATASPAIVEVRRERKLICQRTEVAQRPHASRAGGDHHQIVTRLGR